MSTSLGILLRRASASFPVKPGFVCHQWLESVSTATRCIGFLMSNPELISVILRDKYLETPSVMSLELVSPTGQDLPAFQPGAHIDLHLQDGMVRQYSLSSDPHDLTHYRLGIRLVPGRASSEHIQRKLNPGESLKISAPRNHFPMHEAGNYLFIAGGIGITPLLPMMRAASRRAAPWSLLYCNRHYAEAPFLAEVQSFGGTVSLHSSEAGTRLDVTAALADVGRDTKIYCCGPESLMDAVERATKAWPAGTVNFEWFSPKRQASGQQNNGFEVVCQRAGVTLTVPPDKSILEVLNDAGISVMSSCEQGVCGSCEVRVLSGEVDHRDSILSAAEKASNATAMICVSRARGERLVLDI
jgi:ferredoxin-NADP reductase